MPDDIQRTNHLHQNEERDHNTYAMNPTWIEHATFWSGVKRATIAPRILCDKKGMEPLLYQNALAIAAIARWTLHIVFGRGRPKDKTVTVVDLAKMNATWIDHATFKFGDRRATIAPWIVHDKKCTKPVLYQNILAIARQCYEMELIFVVSQMPSLLHDRPYTSVLAEGGRRTGPSLWWTCMKWTRPESNTETSNLESNVLHYATDPTCLRTDLIILSKVS